MSNQISSSAEFDAHGRHGSLGFTARAIGAGLLSAAVAGHVKMLSEKYHDSREPVVEAGREAGTDCALFPLFGCNTNHAQSANQFEEKLGHLGTVVHTVLPHVGVPIEEMKQKLIVARQARNEEKIVTYGHSAGGIFWAACAADSEFRQQFGQPDLLILEDSFGHPSDISFYGKLLLGGAAAMRYSYTVAHNSHVQAPPYQTAALRHFIYTNRLSTGALEGFAKRVVAIQAAGDRMVHNNDAYNSIRELCGDQPVERVVDTRYRPLVTHNGAITYPQASAQVISTVSFAQAA